nr:hypothetical protein GCM10020092_025290 [Actinoplanes digitatis]
MNQSVSRVRMTLSAESRTEVMFSWSAISAIRAARPRPLPVQYVSSPRKSAGLFSSLLRNVVTVLRSAPLESPTAGSSGSTPVYRMEVWKLAPVTIFMAPRGET